MTAPDFRADLRAWLDRHGLTPYEAGKRRLLGVSQQAIGFWLSGHRVPSNEIAVRALMDRHDTPAPRP
jgi:hypothetical protein